MALALAVARKSDVTHPMPAVGCVLVHPSGHIVRPNQSHPDGRVDHAERRCLDAAGDLARGSTVYTTLEPCDRCAASLLDHGVGRIVYGMVDPYLKIYGMGAALSQIRDRVAVDHLEIEGLDGFYRSYREIRSARPRHRPVADVPRPLRGSDHPCLRLFAHRKFLRELRPLVHEEEYRSRVVLLRRALVWFRAFRDALPPGRVVAVRAIGSFLTNKPRVPDLDLVVLRIYCNHRTPDLRAPKIDAKIVTDNSGLEFRDWVRGALRILDDEMRHWSGQALPGHCNRLRHAPLRVRWTS